MTEQAQAKQLENNKKIKNEKRIKFIKWSKYSALDVRLSKKNEKYKTKNFLILEIRWFIKKNKDGNPIFEKDRNSELYHTFWFTVEETLYLAGLIKILLEKIILSKEEILALFDINEKDKKKISEKNNFLSVLVNFIHTNDKKDNKEIKIINIIFNFKKIDNDKYTLVWLKIISNQKGIKLDTALNKQDLFVLVNFFNKYAI